MDDVEGVRHFLASPRGRAMVRRALDHNALSHQLADDITQEVLRRTLTQLARGTVIDNVEAFATTVAQRASIDVLRGEMRQPRSFGDIELEEWEYGAVDARDDDVGAALVATGVRRALHSKAEPVPARAAAALAYLCVRVDGALVGDGCPQPGKGAGPDDAAAWASLFYAGRDDCFGSSETHRKRRSRAVADMRAMLRDAAHATGLEENDG
jgi:hypothetical protein